MKDSAEAQIARGFLPVIGVLGSALVAYLYVVNAPDPLARLTSPGALVIPGLVLFVRGRRRSKP